MIDLFEEARAIELDERLVTGMRFDPGFGVALALTLSGGAILAAGSLFGQGALTLGGGEIAFQPGHAAFLAA